MILIEAAQSHPAAIVNLDGLHVQILEGLLDHGGPVFLQALEEVRVEMGLVARLVSVPSSDYLKFDVAVGHGFDELVFELIDVLDVRLDDPDIRLGSLDHVKHVPADISLLRWLLLQELTFCFVLIIRFGFLLLLLIYASVYLV